MLQIATTNLNFIRMNIYNAKQGGSAFDTVGKTLHLRRCGCISGTDGKEFSAMYKVARGILDNDEDAADAIQDTILTCFEKIHTLKNPEYFKTWMIRILINECNKIHRHYKNFSRAEELPEVPGQYISIFAITMSIWTS